MKTLAKKLLEESDELLKEVPTSVVDANGLPDSERIKDSLTKRMLALGLEDIMVDEVEVDTEGNILVAFSNVDNEEVLVSFSHDEEEGTQAIVIDDDGDGDEDESLVIDLDSLGPSLVDTNYGKYMNMAELAWLNKNTMLTILDAGDFDADIEVAADQPAKTQDAFGNTMVQPVESKSLDGFDYLAKNGGWTDYHSANMYPDKESAEAAAKNKGDGAKAEQDSSGKWIVTRKSKDEAYKTVIRGGKKVRLPIVRRKKKKRLTPRQRAGLRKASRTRKTGKSKRKRAKSLMVRKRMKLKSKSTPRGYRV